MAWSDYFDGGLDEWEDEQWEAYQPFNFAPRIPTCNRCGRTGYWVKTAAGNWWLQHQCPAMVSRPEDFPDLTEGE